MKTTLFRFGRTAACLTLAVALLTGCSLLPAASPRKDPIPVEQPSDASAALDDGKLRILYDSNGSTVLCGSKVLHEGRSDETVALVYDPAESDIPYYWVAWSDNSSPSGRRSALYDKTGAEVLTFEQDHSVTLSGNYLVLNQTDALEFSCDHAVCNIINLLKHYTEHHRQEETPQRFIGMFLCQICNHNSFPLSKITRNSQNFLVTSFQVTNIF